MTDPLSVTASAAGIVSLAISVCQSFVRYYGSWKSYGEDIKKLCQYLELVSNNMRHLQICIETHQFPVGLKQQVESSILGCTEEIRTLSAELILVKATELPEGPRENVKSFFRRAQYPFKESTLKKIGDSVLRLQAVVDFALSILGVDSLGALSSKAITIVTEIANTKQDINMISQKIPSIQAAIDRVDQALPAISNSAASVNVTLQDMREDIHQMRDHIQRSEERLAILPTLQESVNMIPSRFSGSIMQQLESHSHERYRLYSSRCESAEIVEKIDALGQEIKRLQLQCISKPSLLRDELENVTEYSRMVSTQFSNHAEQAPQPLQLIHRCSCGTGTTSTGSWLILNSFQIISKLTKAHRRDCPLATGSQQAQKHLIEARTFYAGSLLTKALEVSLGLRYGAGGCSLAFSIRLRTIIRDESPAFQLFDSRPWYLKQAYQEIYLDDYLEHMTRALHTLKLLFDEGKASPNDIDVKGRTVLQIANKWVSTALGGYSHDPEMLAGRRNLLLGIARLGVPLDDIDLFNKTIFFSVLEEERRTLGITPEWHIYSSLCELAPVPIPLPWSCGLKSFMSARDIDEYADSYYCGMLSRAILAKSPEKVEKALRNFPNTINERNKLGQTPLHLAADWPWGTTRLLAAGACVDIDDDCEIYPINYACALKCWTTFTDLLASESPFILSGNFSHGEYEICGYDKTHLPPHVFDQVCAALVDRRKRLSELAERVLPAIECRKYLNSNSALLDSNAKNVYKLIADGGFHIPSALKVPWGHITVYHVRNLNCEELQKLYDVDFREVDAADFSGKTPLMVAAYDLQYGRSIRVCEWLISKGANPLKKVNSFGTSQVHYLGIGIAPLANGTILQLHTQREQPLSRTLFSSLLPSVQLLFQASYRMSKDRCRCGCSPYGCSPLTLFLRHVLNGIGLCSSCHCRGHASQGNLNYLNDEYVQQCWQDQCDTLYFLVDWLLQTIYGQQEIPDSAYHEVVNLFLFSELGLTHTCCASYSSCSINWIRPKRQHEVHEIQDEEGEILRELEMLCAEGNARRASHHGPFSDFLRVFLLEVRVRPSNKISEEYIRKIEEIGVVLDADTEEAFSSVPDGDASRLVEERSSSEL